MKTREPSNNSSKVPRIIFASVLLLCASASRMRAGVMLDLFYQTGYPGETAVTNLTQGDIYFPGSPDAILAQTNGLQDVQGVGTNYGIWSRGFLEPPETGQYTFWIASADDSQFWLSTNATTNNVVMICQNVGAVSYEQYHVKPAQQSAPISLVAGQKYYFEMFHVDAANASGHAEVSWQLPDGTTEAVVSESHLWAFPEADLTGAPQPMAPEILNQYQGYPVASLAGSYSVLQDQPLDLEITAEASQPAYVQWYSNNVAIPGADLADYLIPEVSLDANGATYSVIVSNSLGTTTASTTVSVTPDTTPPTLEDALNLGNPGGDVAVVFSKAVDPATATNTANYAIPGATILGARVGAAPDTVLLRVAGLAVGTAYMVTVNNVKDLPGNVIAANSSVAIDQGLLTWLPVDESAGPTVHDFSGNNLNGALVNGAYPGYAGKVFKAVNLDGVDGYIQLPNGYADFTNGLTMAVWAYPTSSGKSWARFFGLGNGAASDNILFGRQGISDNVAFQVYQGSAAGSQVVANNALSLDQWQQLTATLDGAGNVTIYKNGAAVATGTTAVPNALTRTQCYVGKSDWVFDGYYQGELDDVRIYNRVLSPAAIQALANGGGPDDASSLPTVSILATVPTTAENNTPPGVFSVTRTGDTNNALTIQYAISGTAINGVNYTMISNSVVIPAGATNGEIQIAPVDFSFTNDASRSVILRITDTTNYMVGVADSGTVTILNNDVLPTAILATADNALPAQPLNQVDVWFAAPVTLPTATNLANYTLNVSGVNVTSATLRTNFDLGVVLQLDSPVPTNAVLSVSGVQDASGHTSPSQIPVQVRLEPFNVVANVYHGAANDRATAFAYASDGVVNNANNNGTGFDTWNGTPNLTQFAGMIYETAVTVSAVKVDLGQQFVDGGIWKTNPFVYIS
ncbi:MAG: hypothetical protein KGJ60_07185 [Verrucomicrobiota bacterium]|nr:hypothetical protein [Verrucomicrobiota bacterium]